MQMKNKISLSVITVIATGLCLYILISTLNFTDVEEFNSELEEVKYASQSNVSSDAPIDTTTINVPTRNDSEELIEIVLTPEEIEMADSQHNIGISDPYNTKYITEDEVVASIMRIIGERYDFTRMEEEFKEKFITLRHTEMIEKVPESKSMILNALDEYLTKVKNQESILEENTKT